MIKRIASRKKTQQFLVLQPSYKGLHDILLLYCNLAETEEYTHGDMSGLPKMLTTYLLFVDKSARKVLSIKLMETVQK